MNSLRTHYYVPGTLKYEASRGTHQINTYPIWHFNFSLVQIIRTIKMDLSQVSTQLRLSTYTLSRPLLCFTMHENQLPEQSHAF